MELKKFIASSMSKCIPNDKWDANLKRQAADWNNILVKYSLRKDYLHVKQKAIKLILKKKEKALNRKMRKKVNKISW